VVGTRMEELLPSHGASVCTGNARVAREWLGFRFESCDRDCVGAAVTDAMLAAHAGWSAWRLLQRLLRERERQAQRAAIVAASRTGPTGCAYADACQPVAKGVAALSDRRWRFGTLAVMLMATNSLWSVVGASYWLQPGGSRWPSADSFEVLWRINSQCQAMLIYVAYLVALTLIRVGEVWPTVSRHETTLTRLALAHAMVFGLVCLWPGVCEQPDYVLWGGVNIMPPLLTQWAAIVTLVFRHGLATRTLPSRRVGVSHPDSTVIFGIALPCHALFGAAVSGVWFWLGNSAIIVGRDEGLALWIRRLASAALRLDPEGRDPQGGVPPTFFEEMAVFHIFGIVGNELLFRSYEWVALSEVGLTHSRPSSPTATPPHGTRRSRRPSGEEVSACPSTVDVLTTDCSSGSLGTAGRTSPPVMAMDDTWLATLLGEVGDCSGQKVAKVK